MYKIVFFVPKTHCELVKDAIFKAGAGKLGNYENCSWQVLGQGQFMPLNGSAPFLGRANELEKVDEYRVETICLEANIAAVVAALKHSHPYEEPAYDVYPLEKI